MAGQMRRNTIATNKKTALERLAKNLAGRLGAISRPMQIPMQKNDKATAIRSMTINR